MDRKDNTNRPFECPYSEDHLFLNDSEECIMVCRVTHTNIKLKSYKAFCEHLEKSKCKKDYENCPDFQVAPANLRRNYNG